MPWQRDDAVFAPLLLNKLRSESRWAARWCVVAWAALSAFLLLLLIGHVFSVRSAVTAAVPFAFGSAIMHVIAMSELCGVYWYSRKAYRTFSEYSDSALHHRTGRGALLSAFSQNCAFLAFPLAHFALLSPWLWFPVIGTSAMSLAAARYASRTSDLIERFNESNKSTSFIWL